MQTKNFIKVIGIERVSKKIVNNINLIIDNINIMFQVIIETDYEFDDTDMSIVPFMDSDRAIFDSLSKEQHDEINRVIADYLNI